MDELIKKLRNPVAGWSGDAECVDAETAEQAAAEIERLTAALLKCREMVGHPDNIAFIDAALGAEQKGDQK